MNGVKELQPTPMGKPMLQHFMFEPGHRNLNHASYGAHPKPVHDAFTAFQNASNSAPDRFLRYEQADHLLAARKALAEVANADVNDCVIIPNATTGVNTVLRNLVFEKGDVILYFSTIYGACEETLFSLAETTGVGLVRMEITYGVDPKACSDKALLQLFERTVQEQEAAGKKVRVAIYDLITSMPGVRMPFESLTAACRNHNILSLIDGAHGIGQFALDLKALDPDFLVSNAHKWLFTPRACALFYVSKRVQHLIRTTFPTSHGFVPTPAVLAGRKAMNPLPPPPEGMTEFVNMFQSVGTNDVSAFLCVPEAIRFRREVCGGEEEIYGYCSQLASEGGRRVVEILGTEIMENEEASLGRDNMMVNVRLPLKPSEVKIVGGKVLQEGEEQEFSRWLEPQCMERKTFIQTFWHGGSWWTRLSAQVYLALEDFEWAGSVLKELCGKAEKEGLV